MLNRRQFLKLGGLFCLSLSTPFCFRQKEAIAAAIANVDYVAPSTIPQIINIFLYGGPSELAGNLTNIADINANSQNTYPASIVPDDDGSDITQNYFWGQAGGDIMEVLLSNSQMSVYRTANRIKDNTRAHGRSVTQNLVGNLDLLNPGIATTLAAILELYNPFGKDINELVLPFVTFEGESTIFNLGDLNIPQVFRPMSLDSNFKNPYERSKNWYLDGNDEDTNDSKLDSLAQLVSSQLSNTKVYESFSKRAELEDFIASRFNGDQIDADLPSDSNGVQIQYPSSNFGNRLKAAVSLAIKNPDTIFISLGSGGLGGWDDHSGALDDYPSRMNGLMEALQVAAQHMEIVGADNIAINVFGDFGRNVNLNKSQGWDHGNNQNFYTVGGSGIPGRTLGKLVGKTRRIGTPLQNRQFTSPTDDSYQFEPFAIASTIFKYFGVQNPEILTGELPINESAAVPNELV
ncbi:MAG: DUF1501 domain-containing protein [Desulfobacterales bacterium]|jgi:hypothetical protein